MCNAVQLVKNNILDNLPSRLFVDALPLATNNILDNLPS